jgi:hypothetical protein
MQRLPLVACCLLAQALTAAAQVDENGARARLGPGPDVGASPGRPRAVPTGWAALGPFGGDVHDVAGSPTATGVVLAAVAPSGGSGGTMVRSTDGGATWTGVPLGIGLNDSTYEVTLDPAAPGTIWAGVADHGGYQSHNVLHSTDSGATHFSKPGLGSVQVARGRTGMAVRREAIGRSTPCAAARGNPRCSD